MRLKEYDIGESISEAPEEIIDTPLAAPEPKNLPAPVEINSLTDLKLDHDVLYNDFEMAADTLISVCYEHEKIARSNRHHTVANNFKNLMQDVQGAKKAISSRKYSEKLG